ncbi:flavin-dependent oxidoreductase [Burkholderia cenocepacia]
MYDEVEDVIVVGGGIGGLTLALALHEKGVRCRVFEAVPRLKPLGVGLNLLPHAMREMDKLGLVDELCRKGIETREYSFYTQHGQLVDHEPRGRYAGLDWPQVSIHRGDLQMTLYDAACARLGSDAIVLGQRLVGFDHDERGVMAYFEDATAEKRVSAVRGKVLVACDGVHSVVRRIFHPREAQPRYQGSTQYRGVTRWKPFQSGASMCYIGTFRTGKLITYPIRDNIDGEGRQLMNWVIEYARPEAHQRDWNREGKLEDFIHLFEHCRFDWLDVPAMLRAADAIYEYPMVDQDPLSFWTQGRVTLLGDAAHPMMPRGSNGAAQAIIDATTLAELLGESDDWPTALKVYEERRLPATSSVVLANREIAPDAILLVVDERTGGQPFDSIDDVISRDERKQWQLRYKEVAGFSADALAR